VVQRHLGVKFVLPLRDFGIGQRELMFGFLEFFNYN
jgi:hypothetical protein